MSDKKRKRELEESQAHKDGHHKQKKRRKSGVKATVEPQATSGSKNEGLTQKTQASANEKTQAAKTRAQQRGSEDNHKSDLDGDGASPGLQTGDHPSKDDADSADQSPEVKPEDQAAKAERRKEVRRQEKEKKKTTNTQQQDRDQKKHDDDKKKKPKKKKERKRTDVVLEYHVADATAEEQMAKELKRRLWPIKNKEQGDKLPLAEKKARRAVQDQKKLAKRAGRSQKQQNSAPIWRISEAIGGRMLSVDPIFSPEEDCILVGYDKSVHVYSISTSLLLRKLRVKDSEQISSFALSPSDTTQLLLSRWSGIIEKWDWTNGSLLDMWDTKTHIRSIATLRPSSTDNNASLIYTIDRLKGKRWMITAHRLMKGENASKSDLGTLLKYEEPISTLQVFEEGKVIVATSGQKVLIGYTEDPDKLALKTVSYIWREITCSEWITSIDTRIRPLDNSSKNIKPSKVTTTSAVDIVVGGLKGAMFIYEDLLSRLISKENSSRSGVEDNMTPRKLHWHRNAVSSVKWSADGNYVISGGHETVLIIWQLDTGHKQELPHLSAAIESLVVSPTGTSYGIRLADNSAMILSTTELLPTFSVAGIQLPSEMKSTDIELPFIPTINAPTESSLTKQATGLPVVASSKASQILLAVPADASSVTSSRHTCFLQTIDVYSAQQVSRQALARNKVTALNMGPEQNIIEEPNVTHMLLSHNGLWLATVEEWMPPERDLDHLAFDHQRTKEEQSSRLEVYLKFWAWDDDSGSWELVSRINNPQQTSSRSTGTVLDLATDPVQVGFATVGEDGVIKLWKPQTRKRHGLDVRNKEGKSLISWDCRWTTHTPSTGSSSSKTSQTIKLALSPDGSVLVAGVSGTSIVHFIDASSGTLHSSLNAIFNGPLYGLCIIDRYLITLSQELRVWDMVTEELHYGFAINANVSDPKKRLAHTHLAVDQKHNVFAIAFPELGATSEVRTGSSRSRIAVFDVEVHEPVYNNLQPNLTTSLLPISGKKGFYCIDTAAEVKMLSAGPKMPDVLVEQPGKQRVLPTLGLGNIYGDGKANEEREVLKLTSGNIQAEEGEEDEMRVVSPEKLAEVFEAGSAFALPPVSELFERVAVLFAGRNSS